MLIAYAESRTSPGSVSKCVIARVSTEYQSIGNGYYVFGIQRYSFCDRVRFTSMHLHKKLKRIDFEHAEHAHG